MLCNPNYLIKMVTYNIAIQGVHLIFCFFPQDVMVFLNSASSVGDDRPAIQRSQREVRCTHSDKERRESHERPVQTLMQPEPRMYFNIFEKTQYLMNTLQLFHTHTYSLLDMGDAASDRRHGRHAFNHSRLWRFTACTICM